MSATDAAEPRVLEVDDAVAVELAGVEDRALAAMEERLGIEIHLRGNEITLVGAARSLDAASAVIREVEGWVAGGRPVTVAAIDALAAAAGEEVSVTELSGDVIWRRGQTVVAPRTPGQKRYVDAMRDHTITFGIGPAGTGKTFLAVALAAAALTRREVDRLILARPAVEAGERLGFLPGDLAAKVDPYLRPLFDALYDMLEAERVETLFDRGNIEVAPLAFMRGRTLNDSFIILDEAQNTTEEQMKMALTRLGNRSRMVVTGDVTQIDLGEKPSGLVAARRILSGIDDLAICELTRADVVRHRLVQAIVDAYAASEEGGAS